MAIYRRNPQVLSNCHVLRTVFDFKIDGIKQEGNKSYPKKALVWICPPGVVFTKDDCVFLMKEYFSLCQRAGTIISKVLPSFDYENGYHVSSHWMKHLSLDDLEQVFQLSHFRDLAVGLTTFFKLSKNNLYSYIQEGAASKEFFERFRINKGKYLLPQDITRVRAFFPELADDDIETKNVTENQDSFVVSPDSTTANPSTISLIGTSDVAVRSIDFGPIDTPTRKDTDSFNVSFDFNDFHIHFHKPYFLISFHHHRTNESQCCTPSKIPRKPDL
jgi:hypothetical protein